VLDVRRIARPRSGGDTGVKLDARSERWREHRKKVRGEIVEAAFRAIDRLGPNVSVREIAEEAGTAKPKIYRHFHDKSDLFQAIGEITLTFAEMFNNELREMELDRAAIELAAFAAFGSAQSATDWWLGPTPGSPRRMPRDEFVAHLTTIMMGVIIGTAEVLGIRLDPSLPIHDAVPRTSAAS
jgi:AcrR family transcriptional regulator